MNSQHTCHKAAIRTTLESEIRVSNYDSYASVSLAASEIAVPRPGPDSRRDPHFHFVAARHTNAATACTRTGPRKSRSGRYGIRGEI